MDDAEGAISHDLPTISPRSPHDLPMGSAWTIPQVRSPPSYREFPVKCVRKGFLMNDDSEVMTTDDH